MIESSIDLGCDGTRPFVVDGTSPAISLEACLVENVHGFVSVIEYNMRRLIVLESKR
jgi:hypothetical protein